MGKRLNLGNKQFGRLLVQEFVGNDKFGHSLWSCLCACGNTKVVSGDNLKRGLVKSCGCLNKELVIERMTTHGQTSGGSATLIYKIWQGMLARCYNLHNKSYKDYGGRGIKVCDRWHSFENFYEDMGDCPEGLSLDRKDNDGDYTPENCRWATNLEQANNKRSNAWYESNGNRKTLAQWARYLDIKPNTLWMRLNEYAWSEERALNKGV
jgi:hypothetical protein